MPPAHPRHRRPGGRHRRPQPPRPTVGTVGVRGATVLTAAVIAVPLATVGAALTATAAAAAPVTTCITLAQGSKGAAVSAMQRVVGTTADGDFGPLTAAAVKRWQSAHHLPATGVVNAATWATFPATVAAGSCTSPVQTATAPTNVCATLAQGSKGAAVEAIQGVIGTTADGDFGPLTAAAVKRWQTAHHLPPTGVVNAATWATFPATVVAAASCASPVQTSTTPVPPAAPPTAAQQLAATISAQVTALATRPDQAASSAAAVAFAKAQVGVPYLYGGTTRAGYDCSGLMLASYQAAGISLARTAQQQYDAGAAVPIPDLRPGDIVFYASDITNGATVYHNAMYVGGGQMVEAPHTGTTVRIVPLRAVGLLPRAARPAALLVLPARMGSVGFTTVQIQTRLVAHGQRVAVDGQYGPLTAAAVRAFQAAAHLPATGVVDARTWAVLAA